MKQDKTIEVKGIAFVAHVDNLSTPTHIFNLNQIFNDGCNFFFSEVSRSGKAKLMGYRYDLTPYLKKYLVKQYGSWQEYFAPNKTLLRKSIGGRIDKIQELN